MYEYRIDQNVSNQVIDNLNQINFDTTINSPFELYEKIDQLNNKLQIDKNADVIENQIDFDQIEQNKTQSIGQLSIKNINAFDSDKINEYKQIDHDYQLKMQAINFEKSALEEKLQTALENMNILQCKSLTEKIAQLNKQIDEQNQVMQNIKQQIMTTENEYQQKLDQLDKIINQKDYDMTKLNQSYDKNLIEDYQKQKTKNLIKSYLNKFEKQYASFVLENDHKLKDILQDDYQEFVKIYS